MAPCGIGAEAFWNNVSAGKSGISQIELFPGATTPERIGGEIKNFDEKTAKKTYLKPLRKQVNVMCREIQFGVAAAALALEHANLNLEEVDNQRMGVDYGANLMLSPPEVLADACFAASEESDAGFKFDNWGTTGLTKLEPKWLLKYLPNMPACHIAILADARGPSNSLTLDEASGNLSMTEAANIILRGAADTMITGTTGTKVHPVKSIHAAFWDDLSTPENGDPTTAAKPFDANRSGQVAGEGAAVFILENDETAKARGARILGYFLGGGSSCVLGKDGKPVLKQAWINAARAALRNAGLTPDDVGSINANGWGTPTGDGAEAEAIHEVFGDRASSIPVTAIKSYIGNTGSSCGSIELAASVLGLQAGVVPATLNYETPDPEIDLNIVRGEPLTVENKIVLNANFTRMGQASAVVVEGA